jgi:signal transduction histidine kinase
MRVRTRLTLLYATLFLVGGGLLVVGIEWSIHDFLYADLSDQLPGLATSKQGGSDGVAHMRDEFRDQTERRLARDAGLGLVSAAALSAVAGGVVSGRLLARVRRVTEAARAATEGNLSERLNLPGPHDEIKELGDTFDAMLARLDDGLAAQRRFLANASHELRTPLAVTRTAVEVTLAKPDATVGQLRAMGIEVCAAMSRAQRLVDSLLVLARSEQRLAVRELDDLADIAGEVIDQLQRQAAANGVQIQTDLAPAPVAGDIALLSRAVANLVENGIRYNYDEGTIGVATGGDGDRSWLQVVNTGPVVSTMDMTCLFEAFQRGDGSRLNGDGVGLGLSIVSAVARAHAGMVGAHTRDRASGGGLSVTLTLPVPL